MTEPVKDFRLDFKTKHWNKTEHFTANELEIELVIIAKLLPMLQPGECIRITSKNKK